MNARLAITTWHDQRNAEQLRHSDSIDEKRWRWRVERRSTQPTYPNWRRDELARKYSDEPRRSFDGRRYD